MKGKKGVSCVFLFFKRRLRRQRGSVQWADFTQIWRQWVENAWGEIWFQSLMVKGKEEWRWWWWYIGVHFYSTWFHYCQCLVQWGEGGGDDRKWREFKKRKTCITWCKVIQRTGWFSDVCRMPPKNLLSVQKWSRICFLFRSDQVFFFKMGTWCACSWVATFNLLWIWYQNYVFVLSEFKILKTPSLSSSASSVDVDVHSLLTDCRYTFFSLFSINLCWCNLLIHIISIIIVRSV